MPLSVVSPDYLYQAPGTRIIIDSGTASAERVVGVHATALNNMLCLYRSNDTMYRTGFGCGGGGEGQGKSALIRFTRGLGRSI